MKSQSYVEVMRTMEVLIGTSSGQLVRPSANAFSQARGKLPAATCRGIWLAVLASIRPLFARDAERRVFGLRPVAIDGTWAITPHEASTTERWARPKLGAGSRALGPSPAGAAGVRLRVVQPSAGGRCGHGAQGF